jgi:hypothetical protein
MRWLLGAVDAVFSGAVYSDEGTNNIITRDVLPSVHFSKFWDYDDTWIASSNWSTHLETSADQRYSVVTTNMANMWLSAVEGYKSAFPGHRLMWNEFGTWGSDGILSLGERPFPSEEAAIRDDQEVADLLAAGLAAASFLGYRGICIWGFDIAYSTPRNMYCGLDAICARRVVRAMIGPRT